MSKTREQQEPTETEAAPALADENVGASDGRVASGSLREWIDALVIALVLACFLRIFVVELYKIPTGSMTPTLIGGDVARIDVNGDGKKDLILFREGRLPLLFLDNGERLVGQGEYTITYSDMMLYKKMGWIRGEYDRILVNKFAYWFGAPGRGDIVIFKVPHRIWEPDKAIYVKRCAGRPGDMLTFDGEGHLIANGEPVAQPEFFTTQRYVQTVPRHGDPIFLQPFVQYEEIDPYLLKIDSIHVPPDQMYAFGDNTHGSLDSRYWGGVPLENLKGRAFFRYWPLGQMTFLARK